MNNRILATAALLALGTASAALAQADLVGKYSGTYTRTTREGDALVGVVLEVREVVDGKVKGTVQTWGASSDSGSGGCDGTYPVEGTLAGSTLRLRTTAQGGPAKDCWFTVGLMVEGDRLVGKTRGGRPVRLRKK
jgi:hypothetical protein